MGSRKRTVHPRGCCETFLIPIYIHLDNLKMCHPKSKNVDLKLESLIIENRVRKARKVVKKYRKMSLKKEMKRLRRLIPGGESLQQTEVLDQTILMIQELEMKLLARIHQTGIPARLAGVLNENNPLLGDKKNMNLDIL